MRLEVLRHRQESAYSCLPACFRIVLHYLGREYAEAELAALCGTRKQGTTSLSGLRALVALGCDARFLSDASLEDLEDHLAADVPPIVFLLLDLLGAGVSGSHAVVLVGLTASEVFLLDPSTGQEQAMRREEFLAAWSALGSEGILILDLP